ncbi:MAG TPA: family 78 glycoside hydrolase catalytic domain, partial [Clostridiaceae bacterium]|nr:family 78 glycoside hydrolase catalytic domain [Clostridiaceae bacterium]
MNTKLSRRTLSIILTVIFMLTTFISTALPVSAAEGDSAVTYLRVEYKTNPIGIDVEKPRFSWIMESDTRGQKQTAYQILVSTSPDVNGDVWDSGKVNSDKSIGIEYEGPALQSRARYYWKVFAWDKDGNRLESETAWFEMGLLDKSEWTAKFIAIDSSAEKISSYTIELDFMVEQDAAGVVFGGKDGGNFLMWQINTYDYAKNEKVYFRPHVWRNGAPAVLVEKDISNVIPWSERFSSHHLKIEVTSSNEIITYVDGIEIDRRTDSMASFGQFGFRQTKSVNVSEGAYFDNIVITDNTDGKDKVLFNENFDSGINPFSVGQIVGGKLFLKTTEVNMQSVLDSANAAPMFRKEFTVDPEKEVKRARLYSSALGVYEAYINGRKVGTDKLAPGWTDYFSYVFYQTYDVTDLINQGENAIGAIVGNGWYSGHVSTGAGNVNKYGVDVAFIGQLEIEYTDGTRQIIATDDTWKSTKNGPFLATDNQDGETYDARREMPGWDKPDFDDSDWNNTKIATKSSINTKVDVEKVSLRAQIDPPVTVTQELTVKSVTEPEPGVYIFDLGQNIAGWARIKVKGPAGTKIRLRYGEMLYDEKYESQGHKEGTLYTENLRTAKATDYYILKGDPEGEVYEPRFTFHGFRYIEVTGYPGVPTADDVTGVVVGSDIKPVGYYETSDPLVNQLFSNIVWGQRGNFLSIPTDCPQRDERLGWTGDAQVFSRTAMINMDVNQFFRKYMLDVKTAQRANGAIYDIAPAQGHAVGEGNAAWADAAVIIPWNMYITYGDTRIIEEFYDMMQKHIAYYRDVRPKGVAGTYIIKDCAYGDWLSIGESTPNDVVATAYFAYSTDLLSRMARVIGKTEDAEYYEQLFEDIRADFNRYFVSENGMIKGNSQTAYLLALKMNLLPTEELRQKAAENLIKRLEANNWHLSTGFVGVSYLCPVLSDMGYSDVAYQLLLNQTYPSWLYSVVNGATTIWERWNSYTKENGFGPVSMNSFNHYSYGSIGEWMYNHSAGIDVDTSNPGYKHILIKPEPNKAFSYVKGSYDSVYGKIESNWTLDKDTGSFVLNVRIPANTTATVY